MCKFFSFMIDQNGKIYALLGEEREKALRQDENPDSHSYLAQYYGLDEDETWKFEVPFNKKALLDLAKCDQDKTVALVEELVNNLKNYYDGGLSLENMSLEYIDNLRNWLCDHIDLIAKDGLKADLLTQALANVSGSIIVLDFPKDKDQIIAQISELLSDLTGHNEEWIAGTMLRDSRGVFFRDNDNFKVKDLVALCPEFKEEPMDNFELRFRVKICNFPEGVVPKLYINKYFYTFIKREGDSTKLGKELRLFIYPAFFEVREGEVKA